MTQESNTQDQLVLKLLLNLRQGNFQYANNCLEQLQNNYQYAGTTPSATGFNNLAHIIRQLLNKHITYTPPQQRPLRNLVAIEESQNYDPNIHNKG